MIKKQNTNKFLYPFLFLLLLMTLTILPFSSIAKAATEEGVERIYDYAQTLTSEEKNDLEDLAESYYEETGNNYLVVTTTTRGEYDYEESSSLVKDCELYSEAFYDSFLSTYGNDYKNCVILTVDLSENRYADISGQNELKTKLDSERCTLASEKIVSYLHEKDYANAYSKYMKTVNRYQKIKPGLNPDSFFLKIWFHIIVSLLTGGIIIGIMIYNSGGKMTANGQTYLDENRSRLLRRDDFYVRTHTTRTKRETSSNSGSSGGGGSSSGGSHGGSHF